MTREEAEMKRWTQAILTAGLVVGALVLGGTAASADTPRNDESNAYADAMWYFVPQLGRYAVELDRALAAVQVKPETASDLAALAHRGEYMVYDLEGTPVPPRLANAHERLLAALRQLGEAAQIGAEDADGARALFDSYEPMLEGARQEIRSWMMARVSIGTPIESPVGLARQ